VGEGKSKITSVRVKKKNRYRCGLEKKNDNGAGKKKKRIIFYIAKPVGIWTAFSPPSPLSLLRYGSVRCAPLMPPGSTATPPPHSRVHCDIFGGWGSSTGIREGGAGGVASRLRVSVWSSQMSAHWSCLDIILSSHQLQARSVARAVGCLGSCAAARHAEGGHSGCTRHELLLVKLWNYLFS